jgi:chromosome segregation ATPase
MRLLDFEGMNPEEKAEAILERIQEYAQKNHKTGGSGWDALTGFEDRDAFKAVLVRSFEYPVLADTSQQEIAALRTEIVALKAQHSAAIKKYDDDHQVLVREDRARFKDLEERYHAAMKEIEDLTAQRKAADEKAAAAKRDIEQVKADLRNMEDHARTMAEGRNSLAVFLTEARRRLRAWDIAIGKNATLFELVERIETALKEAEES